jgi:LacI family transcriptional regulator
LLVLGYYTVQLHRGILRYAREADWVLNDSYIRIGRPPVCRHAEGILGLITHSKDVEALRQLPPLPLVDLSKGWISNSMPAAYRKSGLNCPRVFYDNAAIARMAAGHFLERGFKDVAYLNFGNYWHEVERIPIFRQTLEAGGCRYHEIPYHQRFRHSHSVAAHQRAHEWLTETLRALPKPLGVVASADDVAVLVLEACNQARLSVPEEVAVLGGDNDPMVCDYALVPLSSVDFDWERIGYEAARLLDRLMDGEPPPREPVLIPPKGVVTRMSTNILAVPNPAVARAVRFIWEHYQENIGTPEVAAAAGLGRRTLEREFSKHLGQTVNHEIAQVRVARAKRLLLETRLKAHQVAEQCGFGDIYRFSKVFQRLTGTSPSSHRRKHLSASPEVDGS